VSQSPEPNVIERIQVSDSHFSPTSVLTYRMCNADPQRPLCIHTCNLDVILAQAFPSILFHASFTTNICFSWKTSRGVSLSPLIICNLGPLILQQPLPFLMCTVFPYLQQLPCLGFSCSSSPSSQFLRTS